MPNIVIDFCPRIKALPPTSAKVVKGRARSALLLGGAFILLALAGGITMIYAPEVPLEIIIGCLVVGGAGGLLVYNALVTNRSLRASSTDQVYTRAPYAFAIADSSLEFPGFLGVAAESWPLLGTSVTTGKKWFMSTLILKHPGKSTRYYLARVLAEPIEELAQRVQAHLAATAPEPPSAA